MANRTVSVLARITARPDKIEELKSLLLGLVAETRKENGCINYHLLHNNADPCDFTFVEEWASDSDIDSHFTTVHVQHAFSKAASLLAKEPDIQRFSIIG
ncbi:putative quinol monooxygenase [Nitrosovibrio tenuis]|uniref:Quinol monooxygenase YgiN n=1 Tax=Nitrosovibrio tenuis TaxID=1233 RepID=A0A1H7LZK2_9PROT|nr:putative quinol monooxygenase [Nitrosovibrio tenuis]SEL04302.1 Quinol monooxygenase YgiN [Nitrosovibrio tenuis]